MFPGAHSVVYRNEDGEVVSWDTPSDEPEYFECCGVAGRCVCDDYDDEDGADDEEPAREFRGPGYGQGDPFNSMDGAD